MKYPIGTKMKWDNADYDDIYVIDSHTKDGKYVVYVTDKNGIRYATSKDIVTEKQLNSLILEIYK